MLRNCVPSYIHWRVYYNIAQWLYLFQWKYQWNFAVYISMGTTQAPCAPEIYGVGGFGTTKGATIEALLSKLNFLIFDKLSALTL